MRKLPVSPWRITKFPLLYFCGYIESTISLICPGSKFFRKSFPIIAVFISCFDLRRGKNQIFWILISANNLMTNSTKHRPSNYQKKTLTFGKLVNFSDFKHHSFADFVHYMRKIKNKISLNK